MGRRLTVYSCNQVKCVVGVFPVESGRSDGDFIKIAHTEEGFTYKQGTDGEGTRSATGARHARVTVSVMQTSAANAYFCALYNGDIATEGGAGIVPLSVTDLGGKDLFVAKEAWIVKLPDRAYAKEAGVIDWEFDCHNPQDFIGGH